MTRVIERAEARYDAREVEYGVVYRWCPASVVVECDCGERVTLTRTKAVCSDCGADHAAMVREELETGLLKEAPQRPWRHEWESEVVVGATY